MQFSWLSMFTLCSSLMLSGCWAVQSDAYNQGRISYCESVDGAIYFTNLKGELCKLGVDGKRNVVFKPRDGRIIDVAIAADGRYLAVVEQPIAGVCLPKIILFHKNELEELVEKTSMEGTVPRFSQAGGQIVFARPTHFVKRTQLAGNFWIDFQIYSFDFENDEVKLLADSTFQVVDDIAVDNKDSKMFISVTSSNGSNAPTENIIECDDAVSSSTNFSTCRSLHVCSADPDISSDSQRLVFVSERDREYHYWLYVKDLKTLEISLIEQSKNYRFCSHPSFSQTEPGKIIALATNSFDLTGQPELDLVKFSDSTVMVLIPNSAFKD